MGNFIMMLLLHLCIKERDFTNLFFNESVFCLVDSFEEVWADLVALGKGSKEPERLIFTVLEDDSY
jgi:hypothetical protein